MSENTPATPPSITLTPLPPISYEVVQFRKEGAAQDFSFTTKVYNQLNAAITDLSENTILDLVNAEVAARMGMAARNRAGFAKLGDTNAGDYGAKKTALIASLTAQYPTKVIFSEADAQAWKPGERELTIGGLQKKITEAIKSVSSAKTPEAKNAAQTVFMTWMTQLQTAFQRNAERSDVVG